MRTPAMPYAFEKARATTTPGVASAIGIAVANDGSDAQSQYASSIRTAVVGEVFFTSAMKSLISCALLIVPVGLFGLHRYTRPAPLTSGSRTLRSVLSVFSLTGADLRV